MRRYWRRAELVACEEKAPGLFLVQNSEGRWWAVDAGTFAREYSPYDPAPYVPTSVMVQQSDEDLATKLASVSAALADRRWADLAASASELVELSRVALAAERAAASAGKVE